MARLIYHDFDLKIVRKGKKYIASVLNSPSGQVSKTFTLPFSEELLYRLLNTIGHTRRKRGSYSDEIKAAKDLGGHLFRAVFSGDVLACFQSSIEKTRMHKNSGLRLKLRLQDVPELVDIPWEFLFDEKDDNFYGHSNRTPIIRFREMGKGIEPLKIEGPLEILVMISDPDNLAELSVQHEWGLLQDALKESIKKGKVKLTLLRNATRDELQHELLRGTYHVFHFIGHSQFDEHQQHGEIALKRKDGRAHWVTADQIAATLRDERLRLVVLNSCESARNSLTDPFSGVATTLVRKDIPAVVAMQFDITDKAAITFAKWFYTAIAEGFPVDAAVAEARKAIYSDGNDIEWATPVLYLRAEDGILFDIEPAETKEDTTLDVKPDTGGREQPAVVPGEPNGKNQRKKVIGLVAGIAGVVLIALFVSNVISKWSIGLFRQHGGGDDSTSVEITPPAVEIVPPISRDGWIYIRSNPSGAKIFLSGRLANKLTPAFIKTRPATYSIELRKEHPNPDYEFYLYKHGYVVARDETTRIDTIIPAVIKPTLNIKSVPGNANVIIGGVVKGQTPFIEKLNRGAYTVIVSKTGYESETLRLNLKETIVRSCSLKLKSQ